MSNEGGETNLMATDKREYKNLDEIIHICQEYKQLLESIPFLLNYGSTPSSLISTAEKLKVLGLNWGDQINYSDFVIRKGYHLTNNGTGHQPDKDTWYVIWDTSGIGIFQFLDDNSNPLARDEYNKFKHRMMEYGCVNYDNLNGKIVFEIENGKKLLLDYPKICKETKERLQKIIKEDELLKAKEKYEKLLAESKSGANE